MVQVTVGSNLCRENLMLSGDTTLRQALEAGNIDYAVGGIHLDGTPIKAGDLDKTFSEMGITTKCYLLQVVKSENA